MCLFSKCVGATAAMIPRGDSNSVTSQLVQPWVSDASTILYTHSGSWLPFYTQASKDCWNWTHVERHSNLFLFFNTMHMLYVNSFFVVCNSRGLWRQWLLKIYNNKANWVWAEGEGRQGADPNSFPIQKTKQKKKLSCETIWCGWTLELSHSALHGVEWDIYEVCRQHPLLSTKGSSVNIQTQEADS